MPPSLPSRVLPLTAALVSCFAASAFAGERLTLEPAAPVVKEANPLSFYDGRITIDFEERLRGEIRENNYDFDSSKRALTDDNWFLQRARLGLKINVTDWLRVYAQAQDSREINSDRPDHPGDLGAEGDDSVDLRQAWVEIGNAKNFPLTARIGRQILAYGDERLVGVSDWNNFSRTFDAVRLRWEEKSWWLEAFTSSVVLIERGAFNQSDFFNGNENDRQQIFSGLYFETNALWFQATDFYAYHLHENDNPKYKDNALGDTNFFTFGTRWKSKPGAFAPRETVASKDGKTVTEKEPRPIGLDYTVELAGQTGNVRGMDLTAFAAHGDVGYTFDMAWAPRLAVGYSFATGDDDPNDHDSQTFQNLFPTNHKFYGQADFFSWQNIHDLEFDLKVKPTSAVTARAEYHAFWLESTEDFWYRSNGTSTVRPLNAAARAAGNYVGSEIDCILSWNVNKHVLLEGGYSHFFAGDYLAGTGADSDADFGYVMTKINF